MLHFDVVTETEALLRQGVLVGLPRIPDRTIHFRSVKSFEGTVVFLRYIHDHVMRVKLRIKQTARVMMILRIHDLACIGKVFRRGIVALADADCGKPFQLPHPDFDRFPVCFDQARIEQ